MGIKSKYLALAAARAASDKKALDIVTIDIRKMPSVADYFVVTSGTSTTHTRAISDSILKKLEEKGEKAWHVEGERDGLWILIDYGDVVAHVFTEDKRRFYNLEKLWAVAPKTHFKDIIKKKRPAARKKAKAKGKSKNKARSRIKPKTRKKKKRS